MITLGHGDFTNKSHVERFMNGEKADLLYADPPWNAGKISYFYNQSPVIMAFRDGIYPTMNDVFTGIAECIKTTCKGFYQVEMCVRHISEFFTVLALYDIIPTACISAVYNDKQPYYQVFGSISDDKGYKHVDTLEKYCETLQGEALTLAIINELTSPGDFLFDPFLEGGVCFSATMKSHSVYHGMGVSEKRFSKTLDFLSYKGIEYRKPIIF